MLNFKEHHLELEFFSPNLDSRLYFITMFMIGYAQFHFGKVLTVTEIWRSQEMQDAYYGYRADYKEKKWDSTHQHWRAIDFSIKDLLIEEAKELVDYLNKNLIYTKEGIFTAVLHDTGRGIHIHIQVDSDDITSIKKN